MFYKSVKINFFLPEIVSSDILWMAEHSIPEIEIVVRPPEKERVYIFIWKTFESQTQMTGIRIFLNYNA